MLAWESLHSIMVGGLAVVVTRQAEELAKVGHEVHIFTRCGEGQTEYECINGVHYHRCNFDLGPNFLTFAYNMSKSFVARLHEFEKIHGWFDIIHGHDWHVVEALNDFRNEGRRVVLTFHSTEYGRNGGNFGDGWGFREVSGKEWYAGYIANRIIAVSCTMKNELCWLYKIPNDKIDVIKNAIDPGKYKIRADPSRTKEKYGVPPLAPIVLFAGRIEYQKGPDLLVEAVPKVLENHREVKFVFAGEGGMRTHLQRRVAELGVEWAAKYLGMIPYRKYIELLNSADIVCIPSRNEPFGIVLLEAWAAGRPVVVTNVGGLEENVENFVDGVKVRPNPESIAWGINHLFNNPDLMEQISKKGREKVRKFRWPDTVEKLMNTYKLALGG